MAHAARRGGVIHRLPPGELRGGRVRNRVRVWLLSGALVELGPGAGSGRIIDDAATAAGITEPIRAIRRSASGGALAFVRRPDGTRAVLRVAGAGWPGDPRRGQQGQQRLGGHRLVPSALGSGDVAGAAWALESALPGARPQTLDRATADAVMRFLADLPRASERPASIARDLAAVATMLPSREEMLRTAVDRADALAAGVTGVMRHGDLWLGNLLVRDGALSGVVDWDAWEPDGVPLADVLHLFGTELALSTRRSLGEVWVTMPWGSEAFRGFSAPYRSAFEDAESPERLLLAGIAWWAAAVAGTLARAPQRAGDDRWVSANVDQIMERLPQL